MPGTKKWNLIPSLINSTFTELFLSSFRFIILIICFIVFFMWKRQLIKNNTFPYYTPQHSLSLLCTCWRCRFGACFFTDMGIPHDLSSQTITRFTSTSTAFSISFPPIHSSLLCMPCMPAKRLGQGNPI